MPEPKIRLDKLLVERALVESREKAQRCIMAGLVRVNNIVITKPGTPVFADATIQLQELQRFVSRGGYKLEAALLEFDISVQDKVCADIGASTGGFTDCLLQYGAALVYAIDVGYGQLHWKLRQDKRVIVMEKINARLLEQTSLPEQVLLIVVDVSFISLSLILPALRHILDTQGDMICLIKPQFEAGFEQVPRGGVIKNQVVHKSVLERFIIDAAKYMYSIQGLIPSPITGADGNREYLAHLVLHIRPDSCPDVIDVDRVVEAAFRIK